MKVLKDVKKIGILRANALGDFLVTIPAINALRNAYPDAELVLFGKPWHHNFLNVKRTDIDRVIIVPAIPGIRDESVSASRQEVDEFFKQMEQERFDLAVHFQGKGIAANKFLNNLKSRFTAGIKAPDADPIDFYIPYYYYQNEVLRYLEITQLIGGKPGFLEPVIKVFDDEVSEAAQIIKAQGKRIVVIHPCATDLRRMWINERFTELADYFLKKGYVVIFTGSEGDRSVIDPLISSLDGQVINLAGVLSLSRLCGLYKLSDLVISVDTGPLHLARAVGAKTIGLYWIPNFINWSPLSRKNHFPVISWSLPCPACGVVPNDPYPFEPKTECLHECSFISDITVKQVIDAAESLL